MTTTTDTATATERKNTLWQYEQDLIDKYTEAEEQKWYNNDYFEDVVSEIVDSCVPVYNSDIIELWQSSSEFTDSPELGDHSIIAMMQSSIYEYGLDYITRHHNAEIN